MERQSVAGRYTLGNYLGERNNSAVFATEIVHARAQKVAIKLIPAAVVDAERQLSCLEMGVAVGPREFAEDPRLWKV